MAQQTKIVKILPQEAAAAGCSATCTSYVENKTYSVHSTEGWDAYRTFTNFKIEASAPPGGLWVVKRIIYDQTYTEWDGTVLAPQTYRFIAPTGANYYVRPSSFEFEYEITPYEYTTVVPQGKHISGYLAATLSNVKVEYEFNGWRITTSVSPAGGGTATGGGEVAKNSVVTLVATPSQGYAFDGWYENGSLVSSSATYPFRATRDRSLVAQFSMVNPVTVTLVAHNGWGQVRFADETPTTGKVSKTVPAGTNVTIEAVRVNASFGYWQRGSGTHVQQQTYTFAPTATETIECYFYYYAFAITSQESAPDVRANVGEVRILVDNVAYGDWGTRADQIAYDGVRFMFEQRPAPGGWEFVHWRYRVGYPYGNWMLYTGSVITFNLNTIEIQAVFRRVPTHLLVNSSTVESPAKLVYDPATNKLVADY